MSDTLPSAQGSAPHTIAHLDLNSANPIHDRTAGLLHLFPEVQTEPGLIDFDRLRLALGEAVDTGRERYGMTWPGKAECFRAIQSPSIATLTPCPQDSVHFDASENVFIEGDNLETLKLLQKSYTGKVKAVYIDPPYNTGHDFVYPDNFDQPLQSYLQLTGQVDAEGKRLGTNTDADGRFHSKWLNMMYPRLYLARNLLREDGVIFISIDDNEVMNLRRLCDEVLGEENFVGNVTRVAKKTSNKGTHFAPSKDYILVYARSLDRLAPFMDEIDDAYTARFAGEDERGKFAVVGLYQAALDTRPNQRYWIECPDGSLVIPPGATLPALVEDAAATTPADDDGVWRWSFESYKQKKHLIIFKQTKNSPLIGPDGQQAKWNIYTKYYLEDRLQDGLRPRDYIDDMTNDAGTRELRALGLADAFDFAKPAGLIERLLTWINDKDALILDFFAGSGTTAQAVLELNAKDGGHRKFILVQLPEPTGRADYPTIADVTKERIRRVIQKLGTDDGFRVFKLAESNFTVWDTGAVQDAESLSRQLQLHVDHIRPDRTDDDLLYEILLKSGFLLTIPVERVTLDDATVCSVDGGKMLVCLARKLTLDAIRAMAERKPERVVCLDSGFAGNDELKTNAVQIFKTKGVPSFKTV
jgi:adenine-specific DNA-methyltransferase